jgi:hypothetical protein
METNGEEISEFKDNKPKIALPVSLLGLLCFRTLSTVRYCKEHNISKTVSVSVLWRGDGGNYYIVSVRKT